LLIALRRSGVDLAEVLKNWIDWQLANIDDRITKQDYYLHRFQVDFVRYLLREIVPSIAGQAPQAVNMIEYCGAQHGIETGDIDEQLVFRKFDFDIDRLNQLVRTNESSWGIEPQPWGMLFVNLGYKLNLGSWYLEVPVPSGSIEQGDDLEIQDIHTQLLTQPKLIIHNKTQSRLLLVDHHMTPETLGHLGLTSPSNFPVQSETF
jgi:hypothetical protein